MIRNTRTTCTAQAAVRRSEALETNATATCGQVGSDQRDESEHCGQRTRSNVYSSFKKIMSNSDIPATSTASTTAAHVNSCLCFYYLGSCIQVVKTVIVVNSVIYLLLLCNHFTGLRASPPVHLKNLNEPFKSGDVTKFNKIDTTGLTLKLIRQLKRFDDCLDLTLKSKFKVENTPFKLPNLNERPRF
jgi:hypothetical protein